MDSRIQVLLVYIGMVAVAASDQCRQDLSSTGMKFMVGLIRENETEPYPCAIIISTETVAHVTIVSPPGNIYINVTVTQTRNVQCPHHGHKAVEIVSDAPVSVVVHTYSDVYLALPTRALSTKYIILEPPVFVFGVDDQTNVTIESIYKRYSSGVTNVQLQKFQRYFADFDWEIVIISDKPVSVIAHSHVLVQGYLRKSLEAQIPFDLWTNAYIIPPLYARQLYAIKVTTSENNTEICIRNATNSYVTFLNENSAIDSEFHQEATIVTANKPINIIAAYSLKGNSTSLKTMVFCVIQAQALSQFQSKYVFLADPNVIYSTLVITIKRTELSGLNIDGNNSAFQSAYNISVSAPIKEFIIIYLNVSTNTSHVLEHITNATFGAMLYGRNSGGRALGQLLSLRFTDKDCSPDVDDMGIPAGHYASQSSCLSGYIDCIPEVDDMGRQWYRTPAGQYASQTCPSGYNGTVKRFCDTTAIYHPSVYNCTSLAIGQIEDKIISGDANVTDSLVNLANITLNLTLFVGDVESIKRILTNISETADTVEISDDFLQVVDNVISETNTRTWQSLINQTGAGAETILNIVDELVKRIVNKKNSSITEKEFAKQNLFLRISPTEGCTGGISFPNKSDSSTLDWITASENRIHMSCYKDKSQFAYSAVMYRNLSKLIPVRQDANGNIQHDRINAPVMSFSFFRPIDGQLENPISITFEVFDRSLFQPQCSYWKDNSNGSGRWETDGCWLDRYQTADGIAVCMCNHLTNFAVLMSPTGSNSDHHNAALSTISLVGCVISMLCLFLTVCIHLIFWRSVRSGRITILNNLCVALFLAYLLFLVGVDKTSNKDTCTAISILLHFAYLLVFFLMLAAGVNIALAVLKPLNRKRYSKWLVIASYVLALLVVGISMGASKLKGYGYAQFCWLTVDSGMIWAFAGPAIAVILVNLVLIILVVRQMFSTVAIAKKTTMEKAKTGLRSLCVLMPLMGLTWLFGIFSINEETVVFQYLFAIFNSLQGLFIFVFHCILNKKIQDAFSKTKAKYMSTESSNTALARINKGVADSPADPAVAVRKTSHEACVEKLCQDLEEKAGDVDVDESGL